MDDATTNAVNETRVDPADWERALGDAAGPQIVVGGPGTGKTEFLVRRVVHLIEIDKVPAMSLLLLSFGRRGTADLERRIRTALTVSVPQIDVSTFHSFAARVVERRAADLGWDDAPQILTGPRAGRSCTAPARAERQISMVARVPGSAGELDLRP